jgi:hypothetical protein
MANRTVQQSVNLALSYIDGSPLTAWTGNEPATSIANYIQYLVGNAPFTWGWNRNENSATSTIAGTQDYVLSLTDFSFLEKVTLTDSSGSAQDVANVYNTSALGLGNLVSSAKWNRPDSVSVKAVNYGTSVTLRFQAVPDQVYTITVTYQKLFTPLTAASSWGIPDQYMDIYNSLFVGECMAVVDDARSQLYRQRGIMALLSKSEGLTEMQKNDFMEMYWSRNDAQRFQMRGQQGQQARQV